MTSCPTCGRSDFASEQGMKVHHKRVHGESLRGTTSECSFCGEGFEHGTWEDRKFCSQECANTHTAKNHNHMNGKTLPDDHPLRHQEGKDSPMYGVEREFSDEHREKLSQAKQGEKNPWYGMGAAEGSGRTEWYGVEGLDSKVQGKLELQVSEVLLERFENSLIENQVGRFNYTVDFVVSDHVVIEAKGWLHGDSLERAEKFMTDFGDEYMYFVVGQHPDTEQMPCHLYFSADEIEAMADKIEASLRTNESPDSPV